MLKHWRTVPLLVLLFCTFSSLTALADTFQKQPDGVVLQLKSGFLKIQVVDENIIRVAFAWDASFFDRKTIDVVVQPKTVAWTVAETPTSLTVATAKVKARVDRITGAVSFFTRPVCRSSPKPAAA